MREPEVTPGHDRTANVGAGANVSAGTGTGEATNQPSGPTAERPWPVRVVSQKIGSWIGRLGSVWVDGQIAQISRRPGAGLVFMTLRDPSAEISLTVTATRDILDGGAPGLAEGNRVVLLGKPEFYAGRGTLSLRAEQIRLVGEGELRARIQRLGKLLAAEGLFDPARKRRLPFLPRTVGLVTGRASAAERDVLVNARRRWPAVEFTVVNVAVQGPAAVPQMIGAMERLGADPAVDVIILARGGGSFEDLLPFNDEALCRAVFACPRPVVVAVGHETDNPLVDRVADVRASTPTDAAKRVVPDFAEECRLVDQSRHRLDRCVRTMLDREQHRLDAARSRPCLARPELMIEQRQQEIVMLRERARRQLGNLAERASSTLAQTRARLLALSPAATLDRGYAVVQLPDGTVLRHPDEAPAGTRLRLRLAGGERFVIAE